MEYKDISGMTLPDLTPTLSDSQKINMNLLSLNTAVNELQHDVKTLNRIVVEGNGELPLREQVRNNTTFINGMRYWAKFLVGALIVQTVTFFFGVIVALVRFLPVLERLANP